MEKGLGALDALVPLEVLLNDVLDRLAVLLEDELAHTGEIAVDVAGESDSVLLQVAVVLPGRDLACSRRLS
jgi:hypothetical protein